MYSFTEENYLKAIYKLSERNTERITTNAIAEVLDTKAASVTDMIKKLSDKKLLKYEKYHGVTLTEKGKGIAIELVRKHRLWETFLHEKLEFGWDEVQDIAEQLEHINSESLTNKLDDFLGNPTHDPHGDPIPDSKGKIHQQQQVNLLQLAVGETAVICAVGSQQTELLEMLRLKNLQMGTSVKLVQRFSFDNSVEISITGQPAFSISEQLARELFVKTVG